MSEDFLAQTLNSRQLLALLFICERKRKHSPVDLSTFKSQRPSDWDEILATFAERLGNLAEKLRFEVIEAHLMSVEDVDVYNNETLGELINENKSLLDFLTDELARDQRFALEAP